VIVLTVSALKLLGASNVVVASTLGAAALAALVIYGRRRALRTFAPSSRRPTDHAPLA
jgi:hypothetical protein